MKSLSKDIFIALIYHGSLSELAADQEAKSKFTKSIQLAKEKKFDRIAFIKKGLDTCINKIFKLNAAHVIIPPPDVSGICRERAIMRKSIHIGVFANNQLRKNVHNQIAAALMIDNTLVHTTSKNEYVYFDAGDRIIEHPTYMPWDSFMFLLSQMDINLYNTYTETWGQIFIESLALGVPCLTNNSSGVLDFDDELREKLLVPEHDNPTAFAKKIEQALAEKEQIISLSARYISLLAKISREKLNDFLN
jgi:glycosyltransferase involved in cell wall biosynthesis